MASATANASSAEVVPITSSRRNTRPTRAPREAGLLCASPVLTKYPIRHQNTPWRQHRFTPEGRHWQCKIKCSLWAKSGHESFTRVTLQFAMLAHIRAIFGSKVCGKAHLDQHRLEGEFSQDNTSVTALANLPLYFATISRLLTPGGALLNHGIINAAVAAAREVRLAARSLTAIFFCR
jgi:hypothetical protein